MDYLKSHGLNGLKVKHVERLKHSTGVILEAKHMNRKSTTVIKMVNKLRLDEYMSPGDAKSTSDNYRDSTSID